MSPTTTASPGRARLGVSINFFTNGLMMSLLPRLPELKQTFALGDGFYGLMVAAMAIGSLCAAALPAILIARFGALRTSVVGMWTMALLLVLAGFAGNPFLFAALLFGMGIADAVVDSAQNTHAVVVQLWNRRTIINSLHAAWSIGAAVGGLIGSAGAGFGVPLLMQNAVVGATIVGLSLVCWRLGAIPEEVRAQDLAERRARDRHARTDWRRLLGVAPLALIALCGVLPEDLAHNWSGVYLVQVFDVPLGLAGLGLVTMLVVQTLGRFTADPLSDRFGAFRLAVAGSLLVALGATLIMVAPHPGFVYLGFALNGFGCASLVPTAYAAAARVPGVSAGAGITLVSFMMRLGMTISSPAIGGLSELFSLRAAVAVTVLAGLAAALVAGRYREAVAGTETPPQ